MNLNNCNDDFANRVALPNTSSPVFSEQKQQSGWCSTEMNCLFEIRADESRQVNNINLKNSKRRGYVIHRADPEKGVHTITSQQPDTHVSWKCSEASSIVDISTINRHGVNVAVSKCNTAGN